MPADNLLATALRAFQRASDDGDTGKIFATTTSLLINLNNPLNLSLLTSHFLTARAIWESPDGLSTCLRVMSIYNTAAIHIRKNEVDNANAPTGVLPVGSGLRSDDWTRAIVKGADSKSNRWLHVLVLAGILMGMEGDDRRSLSRGLRSTLEQAVVTAANLALEDQIQTGVLGRGAVVLALVFTFPIISNSAKSLLNGNVLVPAVVEAMLGEEGLQQGDYISSITRDITTTGPKQDIIWNVNSISVARLQMLESRPLSQNLGPLALLASFAVQHATDYNSILQAHEQLLGFTAGLLNRWSLCPLSSVDLFAETKLLTEETRRGPLPMLWELLKKTMYAVIATLQPIVGRSLLDPHIRNDRIAPVVATKTLHILRNLSFISTRQGAGAFQMYAFTYLTSLDIITRYPDACVTFLQETSPPLPQTGNDVPSPSIQALTLFYLNTAEHLTLSLPTPACETLIITPATAYLSPTSWLTSPANNPPSSLTLELFEASHSCVLSALSCPQHGSLAAMIVPFYIDCLLTSFPSRISPRQFRLAFSTVMQIVSPPFPVSATHPELAETLLEMLRFRSAEGASTAPLLPLNGQTGPNNNNDEAISEQAALVLALVDALPSVPLPALEEWLTRAAEAMNAIADPTLRKIVRSCFWDVLVNGQMDVERSAIGVAWWGTHGGREMVALGYPRPAAAVDGFVMSGALTQRVEEEGQAKEMSRL
ncbi:peroxin 8 [Hypoxylon fragiforme]|uniref:peroxin 8 n=1 Tax=Hypoxylon fragiforme TaxID=63214 RepID=UPI0020C651A4|nr:peroxin 8 [Hypoxylon fragiforme]KAI2612214.1 peroxin 8 [Hypoxylon fragiforme]